MQVPFVIYADFEAVTEKVQGCTPDNIKSYTNKYLESTGCSYGYKVVFAVMTNTPSLLTFTGEMKQRENLCRRCYWR